jgi:predicted dienelactone hydrolase
VSAPEMPNTGPTGSDTPPVVPVSTTAKPSAAVVDPSPPAPAAPGADAHTPSESLAADASDVGPVEAALTSQSGTAELTLRDGARKREIPIRIYYPEKLSGSLPAIVFSPGYGGTRESYAYLGRAWADAGYIVIVPTHLGSDSTALLLHGRHSLLDPATALAAQADRTTDVRFILSSIKNIEHEERELRGHIEKKKLAVAGHSMGAGTALLLAGATAQLAEGKPQAFRDDRIRAALAISPQGSGAEGFNDHSWDQIHVPVMTMSGTRDRGIAGQLPQWRTQAYQHMPNGDKYQVIVNGADHMVFGTGQRFQPCIVKETTAFWNTYLKGQPKSMQSLAGCEVTAK